jgi:hypothetical protein
VRGKAAFGLTRPSVEEFYVQCMYDIVKMVAVVGSQDQNLNFVLLRLWRWFTRPEFELRIVEINIVSNRPCRKQVHFYCLDQQ